MRKIVALVLAVGTVLLPLPAHAGGAAAAALGLASFAVFSQLVLGLFAPGTYAPAPYPTYYPAPVVYARSAPRPPPRTSAELRAAGHLCRHRYDGILGAGSPA